MTTNNKTILQTTLSAQRALDDARRLIVDLSGSHDEPVRNEMLLAILRNVGTIELDLVETLDGLHADPTGSGEIDPSLPLTRNLRVAIRQLEAMGVGVHEALVDELASACDDLFEGAAEGVNEDPQPAVWVALLRPLLEGYHEERERRWQAVRAVVTRGELEDVAAQLQRRGESLPGWQKDDASDPEQARASYWFQAIDAVRAGDHVEAVRLLRRAPHEGDDDTPEREAIAIVSRGHEDAIERADHGWYDDSDPTNRGNARADGVSEGLS